MAFYHCSFISLKKLFTLNKLVFFFFTRTYPSPVRPPENSPRLFHVPSPPGASLSSARSPGRPQPAGFLRAASHRPALICAGLRPIPVLPRAIPPGLGLDLWILCTGVEGCSCRFDYFQIEDGWLRPMPPSWIGFLLCGIGHFASRYADPLLINCSSTIWACLVHSPN